MPTEQNKIAKHFIFEEIKTHEIDEEMTELYLDYQEKEIAATNAPYDRPIRILRSREFRRKQLKVPPSKRETFLRLVALTKDRKQIIADSVAHFRTPEVDTNPDAIWIYMNVIPEFQSQGIGTYLRNRLFDFAREHNRTKIEAGIYKDSHPTSHSWLIDMGFKHVMTEKISRLYKDVINWDFVEESEKKLEKKLEKYTLLSVDKEAYAQKMLNEEGVAAQLADFVTEADNLLPMEDAEVNRYVITEKDIVDGAREIIERKNPWGNRNMYLLDGEKFVAMSGTYYPEDFPLKDVGTGLTAVRKAYHRQGIATYLKIKVLKYYVENHPDFEYIYTENAGSNEGMLSINMALGFRPYFEWRMYQGKLDELKL